MATVKYKIEKGSLAVYLDPTNAVTFDPANLKMIAAATNYELSIDVDEQELSFLGSETPDWSEAQPTRKNWQIACDSLVMYEDAEGTVDVDDEDDIVISTDDELEIGDQVWVAISKSALADGFKYGRAFVKSIRESGTGGENGTYSITLRGQGKLDKYVTP